MTSPEDELVDTNDSGDDDDDDNDLKTTVIEWHGLSLEVGCDKPCSSTCATQIQTQKHALIDYSTNITKIS